MRHLAVSAALVACLVAAGCAQPSPPASASAIAVRVEPWSTAAQPVFAVPLPDGSAVWVAEQGGRVVAHATANPTQTTVVLDVHDRVSRGAEQGLLGLALHPDWQRGDHRFYVDLTDPAGDTRIEEHAWDGSGTHPLRTLLEVDQPYSNHNGGMLAFGPDGMLYIGLGDGGSGGDPQGNGQDLHSLLGKLLRIDVGTAADAAVGAAYAIPAGNPFSPPRGRSEVWAYGLRNPWRFSFDRQTGDLWIGDVGQDRWEEVDHARGDAAGLNYGWNAFEGNHAFSGNGAADAVPPVHEYANVKPDCAVVGGYVYRGAAVPALVGHYVFGDACSGTVWELDAADPAAGARVLAQTHRPLSSFAEDLTGELWVLDVAGGVQRLVAA